MRRPRPIPAELRGRAFTRAEALAAGMTARQLDHPRFVRVHPNVYREVHTQLDALASMAAAQKALGPRAQVSHETRLFLEGYVVDPSPTWHFTIEGDGHIHHLDGVTVHRTVKMPPCDHRGVRVEHAWMSMVGARRVIDAVKAGDWLLRRGLVNLAELDVMARREPWRLGAVHVPHVIGLLDCRADSPPESELRLFMPACGLPVPEPNAPVTTGDGEFLGRGDLVLRLWRLVLEYEGRQHAFDVEQFNRDIGRYDGFRAHDWDYLQNTAEMQSQPKRLMRAIHHRLVLRGYDGPPPHFGAAWDALFRRCE